MNVYSFLLFASNPGIILHLFRHNLITAKASILASRVSRLINDAKQIVFVSTFPTATTIDFTAFVTGSTASEIIVFAAHVSETCY